MLGGRKDNGEVDRGKDVLLDFLGIRNEEVGTKTKLIARRDKVVEVNKALLELFWRIGVESIEKEIKNCREKWLEYSPIGKS